MNTKLVRVPLPNRGDGYRVIRGTDGRMTTVPLTAGDVAHYRPLLAMDQAMPAAKFAGYGSSDDAPTDVDNMDDNPAAPDAEEQVRQLLEGKLDPADLDALCNLIFGDDAPAPAPAQDRRGRRMGRDQRLTLPSRQQMEKLVAEGAARRADRVLQAHENLMKRFPALRGSRVVG